MKVSHVVALSIVLGALLGATVAWSQFGWSLSIDELTDPTIDPRNEVPAQRSAPGLAPKAVVAQSEFNFGKVQADSKSQHTFVIKNEGEVELTLDSAGTTCTSCTVDHLSKHKVPPGDSAEVTVEYHARAGVGPFRQSANIHTNDPNWSLISLVISGEITSLLRIVPEIADFSQVSLSDRKELDVNLYAVRPALEVDRIEFTLAETASFFQADLQAISEKEIREHGAQSGKRLHVTLKPGLPLGAIQQTIRLHTNLQGQETVNIPIEGQVTSNISIAGNGWNAERGILSLGVVDSDRGLRRQLMVLVRGPHRHDLRVHVGKCDPEMLHATLGTPVDVNRGAVVEIPMTVEIPVGSPPVNHLQSPLTDPATITLESTDPQARQVRVYVRFAVERSGVGASEISVDRAGGSPAGNRVTRGSDGPTR